MAKKKIERPKWLRKGQYPPPGTVYLMPLADRRRFGVCRVARHATRAEEKSAKTAHMIVVASPALFDAPPSLDDPRVKQTLVMNHHAWRNRVAAMNLAEAAPREFKVLGKTQPTAEDAALTCNSWGYWVGLANDVLRQWRWDHDREAMLEEDRVEEEQGEREREAQQRERNKPVPLATLRKERLLPDWADLDLPPAVLRKVRAILRGAIDGLIALGPKPKRAAAMKVFQACTEALNELDEANEHFIETIEREDLCAAIDRMARSVGIKTKKMESVADQWREW
jgi:hypothetical protein